MGSEVFFTRSLAPEKVVEAYQKLGIRLSGTVAVKIHSGEKGNQNYLTPEFWKPMVDFIHGTIVECNTAYGDATGGVRDNTESHLKLLEEVLFSLFPFSEKITDATMLPMGLESQVSSPPELYIIISLSDQESLAMTLAVLFSRAYIIASSFFRTCMESEDLLSIHRHDSG